MDKEPHFAPMISMPYCVLVPLVPQGWIEVPARCPLVDAILEVEPLWKPPLSLSCNAVDSLGEPCQILKLVKLNCPRHLK